LAALRRQSAGERFSERLMLGGVDTTNADVGQALREEAEAGRQDRSVWEV